MSEQAAEEWSAADGANIRHFYGRQFFRWIRCCRGLCPVAEPLVRTVFVEKANVFLADVVEMTQAKAQEVIQAFSFEGPNPCFRVGVRIGS